MSSPTLDLPGHDTWLARTLLDRGLVDVATLQELLGQVRGERMAGLTLAHLVRDSGLLGEDRLEAILAEIAGTPQSAELFGNHRIVRKLGAGGMGVVYLAVHEPTSAQRAIKTLTPRDPEAILRFRREGEALARVGKHRHVVSIHDLGQTSGQLYLVMDYAAGGSLADRLKSGPLPPAEAARLVQDLARGLAHVHGHGILHRDLKPANVLFDEVGTVKLVDFGLAKLAWEGSLTASGTVMGTPSYMAPEQVMDSAAVDARSDVYGLGALLYEVLTGRPPFSEGTVLATLTAVLEKNAALPKALNPDVPDWLQSVCLKALAKDPSKRQPTAAALADDLEAGVSVRAGAAIPLWVKLAALLALTVLLSVALVGGSATPPQPRGGETKQPDGPTNPESEASPRSVQTAWPISWSPPLPFDQLDLRTYRGFPRANLTRLFPFAERLAAQGHVGAIRSCGLAFLLGAPVRQDRALGLRMIKRAVKHGDLQAAADLSFLYLDEDVDLELGVQDPYGLRNLGRALGLTDNRLAAALAKLGIGHRKATTSQACLLLLERLAKRGVHPPETEAGCYAVTQAAFEPRSEHWPSTLPTWPVTTEMQFSNADEDDYLKAKDHSRSLPERTSILYHLSKRGHDDALRRLARAHLHGELPESKSGIGLHLLWRALKHGSSAAAGELALIYAPAELDSPLESSRALGLSPDMKLSVACLTILCAWEKANQAKFRPLLNKGVHALNKQGSVPPPTLDQAYAFLEHYWEPPEAVLAEQRALADLDAQIEAWRQEDPSLEADATGLENQRLGTLQLREAGKRFVTDDREGMEHALPRMVISWRMAVRAGDKESHARLAVLLLQGRPPRLNPAPLSVVLRWLFRLAEQNEWLAAQAAFSVCAYPAASGGAVEQDLAAAAAWLRVMQETGSGERRVGVERARLQAHTGLEFELPATAAEAWRIVRKRWPPKLR